MNVRRRFCRASCSAGWRGAAVLMAALLFSGPAAAQQAGDQVADRDLLYRSARSQHDAALAAWSVVEKQWNDAVDAHAQARRTGDTPRRDAALVRALDLAQELDRLERRVKDERAVLNSARNNFMAALDGRIDGLTRQLAAARTPADRANLTALIRNLENEQSDLEEDAQGQAVPVVVYFPAIQFDMRDTPQTLGYKAQLLRSKAEQSDSAMAHIDREIERIDRQLRRSRNAQSLVTGVERFGDIQVPVGAPNRRPPPGDVRARTDSTGVARPEMTPQQLIAELRLLRVQVQEAKRQFLQRAETFDGLIRSIG
ncbi:MAG: hypothetical protein EXR95_08380 [Gemmatimonadetes bacterium]|nr:hypothetical protein [Gemmatimonadota bacterium]